MAGWRRQQRSDERSQGGGQQSQKERIVQQQDAERHREQVEEAVVAGEGNQQHQQDKRGTSDLAGAASTKDQQRRGQFDAEHDGNADFLEPDRQLVRIPANPGWQRLSFIMKRQRGQLPPRCVGAQQFDRAGHEHQPEQQPATEPDHSRRRRRFQRKFRQPLARRQKDREEAGFQQQGVPLEAEKVAANRRKRKVNGPKESQVEDRRNPNDEQQRKDDTRGALELQKTIAGIEPAQGRQPPVAFRAEWPAGSRQAICHGQYPIMANQTVDLTPQ